MHYWTQSANKGLPLGPGMHRRVGIGADSCCAMHCCCLSDLEPIIQAHVM